MIAVLFIYGLFFFILGITIFLYPKKSSSFKLASDLNLIAAFGITHAINEWAEMFSLLYWPNNSLLFDTIGSFFLPVSFFFLVLFGAKVLTEILNKQYIILVLPLGLLIIWLVTILAVSRLLLPVDFLSRYVLGVPGTFLATLALFLQIPVFRSRSVTTSRSLFGATGTFFLYSILTLFSGYEVDFFPASIMNYNVFLDMVGIPIQILRTLCALFLTYSMIRVLRIFDWETKEKLQLAHNNLELRVAERTAELTNSNEALRKETIDHEATEEALRKSEKNLLAYQAQLRHLASELSLAEGRERRRIATLLHNHLGQSLSVIKMRAGLLWKKLASTEHASSLHEIRRLLEESISVMRSLTSELSPPILNELGLESALEWLCERFYSQYGIACKFTNDGKEKTLEEDINNMIYWFVRELLFNVLKHAQAKNVEVAVFKSSERELQITVMDDGIGIDFSFKECYVNKECGFGLFNIRERLDFLGGGFRIETEPGCWTRIVMLVPLSATTEEPKEKS